MDEFPVGGIPLFAGLPPGEVAHLAATAPQLTVAAASVLFREGDAGDSLLIVLRGELEVLKALDTPDERLLGIRGPGEFVGEMSLLNQDGRRTASVRTRTAVQLLALTRGEFEALLQRQPALVYAIAHTLSLHLQEGDAATIRDLRAKNLQLRQALQELQAAQAQLIEKEMLERELQVARQIQEGMLPRSLPRVTSFDFGARMVPARSVGGDFFDCVALSPETTGIVVGDVSGKGIPAALFMALTRSLLRAEALRATSPGEALQNVNRHLLAMNDAGMFVTVLYGVLHHATRAFVYARAGHELPLIIDPHGTVHSPMLGEGVPLGVFPEPRLDEQIVVIPTDGALLLYTDGVTEAQDSVGAFFGVERLMAALSSSYPRAAQALCESVLQTVMRHQSQAPQFDDITLLAVQAC